MLATNKSYKAGELICLENPLAFALHRKASSQYCGECLKSESLSRCSRCKYVFYCSRKCQKSHWSMHKSECACIAGSGATPGATLRIIFYIITSKIYQTDPIFATYMSHAEEMISNYEDKVKMEHFYVMLMVLSNNQINISEEEFFQIFGKVRINAFDLTNPQGNEIGVALYRRSAKFDHSCIPNAIVTFLGKEIRIIASEDIPDASEVRISYLDLLRPTSVRREELQNRYFFLCDCSRCCNTEEDFRIRIPPCCGNSLRGPISADYENQKIVNFPIDAIVLLSNLLKPSLVAPEEIYICDQCHKIYNAAVFDAFERRCYEISSFSDALELYKACAAAAARETRNDYFRLIYEHEESLPFFCLCRTLVMSYNIDKKAFIDLDFNYVELDHALEAGLRLNRCLNTSSAYRGLRNSLCCTISRSFLAILSIAIIGMEECISTDRSSSSVHPRMERFIKAFGVVARAAIPVFENFAPNFPILAEQLIMLKSLALDWNVKI
ncbi:hypothetical protein Aperf_G00000092973 [Anoplocephala perfoliata]